MLDIDVTCVFIKDHLAKYILKRKCWNQTRLNSISPRSASLIRHFDCIANQGVREREREEKNRQRGRTERERERMTKRKGGKEREERGKGGCSAAGLFYVRRPLSFVRRCCILCQAWFVTTLAAGVGHVPL